MDPKDLPQRPSAEPPAAANAGAGPLLTEATLLRARGRLPEAVAKCKEALEREPDSWQAHELLGDLHRQMRKGDEALSEYRTALARNPGRGVLEEKIARASLIAAERRRLVENAEALLAGKADRGEMRKPGISALFSLVIPGLGQIYNHEYVKGLVVLVIWAGLAVAFNLVALSSGITTGGQTDLMGALSRVFSGKALVLGGLLALVWIYAVADAAFRAGKTLTGPEDLV